MKQHGLMSIFLLSACFIVQSSFSVSHENQLSKLMKQMQSYVEAEKKRMELGQKQEALPVSLDKMLKANVTKGKKLSSEHETYANEFYKEYNYYTSITDTGDRKMVFNLMVNSCIACHKHECPGPIVRIEKSLYK